MPKELSPQDILKHKDQMSALWELLPPEHQASFILVLLKKIRDEVNKTWALQALGVLHLSQDNNAFQVTEAHLDRLSLSPEERDLISPEDLASISTLIQFHYENTLFWKELTFHVERILREKGEPDELD
jgi:hypothetical protein